MATPYDWIGSPAYRPPAFNWALPDTDPMRPAAMFGPSAGGPAGPGPSTIPDPTKGFNWGKVDWPGVAKAGIPLLASVFAPSLPDISKDLGTVENRAATQFAQGQELVKTGGQALAEVLGYLQPLLTGDQAAIAAATQPERARVIDQYDAAKKAAEFAPRGAKSSAMLNIAAKQASDLAALPLKARQGAAAAMAQIGSEATRAGVGGEQAAQNALVYAIDSLARQRQIDAQSIWQTFAALGGLAAAFIPGIGPLANAGIGVATSKK